jgi:hypothetical protein
MRLAPLIATAIAVLAAVPAGAQMVKCTARDGTVVYQARPCGSGDREASVTPASTADAQAAEGGARKLADNDPRLSPRSTVPPRDAQERAILERDVAQRRARCAASRETIERMHKLLDSPNEVQRHQAGNEIKTQEKRMKDDACASL